MGIDREDMLELTRRMTGQRSNFVRVAGAYIDDEGFIDGTFNTNFLNLKGTEKTKCLEIAKTVPFSGTNTELTSYNITDMSQNSIWRLFYALRDCELKNDALLLNLYEIIAEKYVSDYNYAIYVYYGVYDVPIKGTDKERQGESEEVYKYLILAIAPTDKEYNLDKTEAGILYPAFTNRSTDMEHSNILGLNKLVKIVENC